MIYPLPSELNAKADVESGIYEIHRPLLRGDRVLDIGANVGYFTMRASEAVGVSGFVVAFEPDPTNFERLAHRSNSFNVVLMKAGALDVDGDMFLYLNPGNCGGHSYQKNNQHKKQILTPVVNIGRWIVALGFTPDFIKIDTEGTESLIIQSLLSASVRSHFAYEVHNIALYHECRRLLEANGYDVLPKAEVVGCCYATKC